MREIRTSGSMRGSRKRAFAWRACLLLYAGKGAAALVPASSTQKPRSATSAPGYSANHRCAAEPKRTYYPYQASWPEVVSVLIVVPH
jgi:hypothetical protein